MNPYKYPAPIIHQWSQAETEQFLAIRAELDRSFTEAKSNKPLWQAISSRMQLQGFSRTPEQCKSKWKNLATRFKACHEEDDVAADHKRQFPFHDQMQSIFSERMARLLSFDQVEEQKEVTEECRKKKRKKGVSEGEIVESGLFREFIRRQMEMEKRWMEEMEEREAERRSKEEEWRREMERLEEEMGEMERRWREREEERRAREEAREERRHALVTALLTKLNANT